MAVSSHLPLYLGLPPFGRAKRLGTEKLRLPFNIDARLQQVTVVTNGKPSVFLSSRSGNRPDSVAEENDNALAR